jgi:PIN domain nuclease of toxin-antitoxin system
VSHDRYRRYIPAIVGVAHEAARRGLLDNAYGEVPITSQHAVATGGLPPLHKDPFDRILVAQAMIEGITLLTADPLVAQYPGPVRRV